MHQDIIKALDKLEKMYAEMTKEEFRAHFKLDEVRQPSCYPDNCDGSCQGAGGCPICDSFLEGFYEAYEDEN